MSPRPGAPAADAELGARGQALIALRRRGGDDALEVFEKRGRSRRFTVDRLGESSLSTVEAGWAVRGGDRERSWFLAGSGELPLDLGRPEAGPAPIRLPPPLVGDAGAAPGRGLEAPLASESEGRALLGGIARELGRELGGARLSSARLDDGASASALISSLGTQATVRARSAALRLEARRGSVAIQVELLARSATEIKPLGVARRVADRLAALEGAATVARGRQLLLASPVAARLLEAWAPRVVGARASEIERAAELAGRLAAPEVSIIDDGARVDGLLSAPFDGEGVPTRAVTLIEEGRFVRPLTAWWEVAEPAAASGCSLRPSWRDLPRRGPTELRIEPRPEVAVADLLAEAGAYLIAAEGVAAVDLDGDRFALPVSGYLLEDGRATAPLGPGLLTGSLGAWLLGVRAVARDLGFVPGRALYGAPSLLVSGLEWRPVAAAES